MRQQLTRNLLAGGGGFEPPLRGPEPRVLPLDDPPPTRNRALTLPQSPHHKAPPPHTGAPAQRMAVFSVRLGRKRGTRAGGIWISWPVRGLRPLRAARLVTMNV